MNTQFGADLVGCTLLRTLIRLELSGTGATLADNTTVACGLIVTEDNITSALLGSFANPYKDWYFWQEYNFRGTPVAGSANGVSYGRFDYDLRSKRRLSDLGQTAWLSVEPSGNGVHVSASIRTLLALP